MLFLFCKTFVQQSDRSCSATYMFAVHILHGFLINGYIIYNKRIYYL